MTMTLRGFCAMSEGAKRETVELWGDPLTEKVVPGYRVKVYQLHDFYVEVYHNAKNGQVERHRACNRRETVVG
ncbi:hypothetical protein [Paracnuella aquatica]|uniref:hypothetical protein n=1 Tax=Paracnuella aquatica TaxID=2268757 RepID=UPI000F4E9CFC|nr:hypothetical protein [Paracnuella aquatica]RPD49184.1 hypothetical protein DRJ53_08705 [Paracnuella aquatica]